jgi:hypothetical protein
MTTEPEHRTLGHRSLAAGLLSIQIVLGLLAGLFHEVGGYDTPEADFYGGYALEAQRLVEGLSFRMTRSGPGYSALLALAGTICGDLFIAAKIIAAIGVAAIGWFSYAIAARAIDPKTGVLLQVLVYIALFRYSFVAGNDIPTAALSLGALYYLLKQEDPSLLNLAVSGMLAGLAAVTRFSAVAVLASCIAAVLFVLPRPGRVRSRFLNLGLLLCGAALPLGAWVTMNMKWHGTPVHSKAYALIALDAYGAEGAKVSQSHLAAMEDRFSSMWDVLSHDPSRLIAYYPLDVYSDMHQLLGDVVTFPAYILIGVGVYVLWFNIKARRTLWVLLIYAALAFSVVVLAPYQARYHYPIAPVLCLPVAAAVASTNPAWGSLSKLRISLGMLAIAVLAVVSAIKTREYLTSEPLEILRTGEVLRANASPGDTILLRKPHLAYLGGIEPDFRLADPEGGSLMNWLREGSKARFLYVGPLEVQVNPALAPLATAKNVPPGFQLMHQTESPPSALYKIGLVAPAGK